MKLNGVHLYLPFPSVCLGWIAKIPRLCALFSTLALEQNTNNLFEYGCFSTYMLSIFWFFSLKIKLFFRNSAAFWIKLYANHASEENLSGNLFWHLFKFSQILFVAKSILKVWQKKTRHRHQQQKNPKTKAKQTPLTTQKTNPSPWVCVTEEMQHKLKRIYELWPSCAWLVFGSCEV